MLRSSVPVVAVALLATVVPCAAGLVPAGLPGAPPDTVLGIVGRPGDKFAVIHVEPGILDANKRIVRATVYDDEGVPTGPPADLTPEIAPFSTVDVEAESAPSGEFVVAWMKHFGSSPNEIFAQRGAADGTPIGSVISVLPAPQSNLFAIDLAVADDGSFWVGWSTATSLRARHHASDGTPSASDFAFHTNSLCCQLQSRKFAIDSDNAGNLISVWIDGPRRWTALCQGVASIRRAAR
jgi:hypothetical protein